jgi:hypothetical protein
MNPPRPPEKRVETCYVEEARRASQLFLPVGCVFATLEESFGIGYPD